MPAHPSALRQATVGVIGHVDHGKTSLVRALTGIDTDRLPEEKARGLSIVPGYAWLAFDEGCVDLVDVPGHEQFVRMMVAGAAGIDAMLLVIDAREGVMPQTREHLAIARLLGVRRGVVAVTKADRVSEPARRAVAEALGGLLRGSPLAQAPRVFTSVVDGEGLAELAQALRALLHGSPPQRALLHGSQQAGRCVQRGSDDAAGAARAFLPIDRAFAVAGAGAVATGTLQGGALSVGERLRLLPAGREAVVRRLQVHGRDVAHAQPGQRVGVALRGVSHHDLRRGDALAGADAAAAAGALLDVEIVAADDAARAIAHDDRLRLLVGTAEVGARVRLLAGARIAPGEAGYAQLHCERPVACAAGQPFVLREASPPATLGGGRVIEPARARHRRADAAALRRLAVLAHGDEAATLAARVADAGAAGMAIEALARAAGRPAAQVRAALAAGGATVIDADRAADRAALDAQAARMADALRRFHAEHPTRAGMPLALLRARLPADLDGEALAMLLRHAQHCGALVLADGLARAPGHDPVGALDAAGRVLAVRIEAAFCDAGLAPPEVAAVLDASGGAARSGTRARAEAVFRMLVERGTLVRVPAGPGLAALAFHRQAIERARASLQATWPPPASFSLSQARELLGSTRKYVVPLMEHFDAERFTVRRGDRRTIALAQHFTQPQ